MPESSRLHKHQLGRVMFPFLIVIPSSPLDGIRTSDGQILLIWFELCLILWTGPDLYYFCLIDPTEGVFCFKVSLHLQ